jgi:hypothetical protein
MRRKREQRRWRRQPASLRTLVSSSVGDPGSGALFDPRDPGWTKNQDPDPGGMNIPDPVSESLETILWVKILKFFDMDANPDPGWKNSDPGSGMEKIRIRDTHPGSATLLVN